jgi:general secretion pathway protein H
MRRRIQAGRQGQAGFTLIELIVVMAVMALIAGLVIVRKPWHSVGLDTEATVRTLTSTLRIARSRAIAQNRDVVVVTGETGFALDGGAPAVLPAGEALSPSQVTFMPDGGSSGATILLASGPRRIAISVNWLTGRVLSREVTEQ